MTREYLRVTNSSAQLDPDAIPTALASLHKLTHGSPEGLISQLNPFRTEQPVTFEFVVFSEGQGEPVEFYYGADDRLQVLEQRLRSIYPDSFDIDRVETDLLEKLIQPVEYPVAEFREGLETERLQDSDSIESLPVRNGSLGTDGGSVLARPSLDDLSPYGVRWRGSVDRRKDWMTSLTAFSETIGADPNQGSEDESRSSRAPLASLIDQLTEAEQPLAFQVVFQRKLDWSSAARRRSGALLSGKDTLLQKILSIESPGSQRNLSRAGPGMRGGNRDSMRGHHPRGQETKLRDRERDQQAVTRLDLLRANTPKRTFTVNARLLALPTNDNAIEELNTRLDNLCSVFDTLDGPHYEIEGERFRTRGILRRTKERIARSELERFRTRSITTRWRDNVPRLTNRSDSRTDLVLNADELANLVVVPSSSDLTVEGSRGTRAEQQSRNPLPRPNQDITRQLREPGLELGYLLDENREPEDEPLRLSADLLPFHVGRFAKTGAGKSIALINDALSLYEQTSGPVFVIDTKGGGLPEHYMRAHAKRFGFNDLEANVIHFDIPERLPGFAFFNIKPALANGVPRLQAVKDRVDHYVEVLKMTMGEERYEQAVVSPNLLKYLLRLMYDEEHGLNHGRYRESVDYFGQSQLEQVVDQLYEAGPPQATPEEAPQSSSDQVASKVHRHLTADPRTFANIMGGVSNRMDYITADPFLQQIFDTTEPRFDIRNILDEDVVVIFDLGDLRSDAAKVMAGVILTNLYDAVTERDPRELARTADDYVANLLIDESASIVVSDVLNDLLEKGREFQLSVELVSQFPEQMELEGDRQVYLNVLNNIGSPIVGKIAVDDEIARALAHEDMDPVEFRNRVRALPRGEWIAQVPSPAFGETGPMPFSVGPLSIPAGHPESEAPLTADEERRFADALDTIQERTQAEYGVPVDAGEPTVRVPDSIRATLELATDSLDELLAVMTRYVQLREGVRETNEPVSVRAVDTLLETWYDAELPAVNTGHETNVEDREVPSREDLAEIRERSPLFKLTLDAERGDTLMRLTEIGEETAEPETGTVQAAGSDTHDNALARVETEFTREGFLVAPVRQDGSGQPDAWAVHPDVEVPLSLEVETTTHTKPAKVLRNLGRAQAHGAVPVFIVPSGEESAGTDTAIARRVGNILANPVKDRGGEVVEFYVGTDHVTFNGGAESDDGVTAVRPVASGSDAGSNRSRWRRVDGDFVLTDEAGTEHARVADVDAAPKEQFPATFSIDPDTGTVSVSVPGELPRSYESEAAFREDWVPIKRPVIPDVDLPNSEYGQETYAIGVLLEDDVDTRGELDTLAIYNDGELHSFDRLKDALQSGELQPAGTPSGEVTGSGQPTPVSADGGESESDPTSDDGDTQSDTVEESASSSADGATQGVESFAEARLVEDEENVVPFREVYDAYYSYAEENRFDTIATTHFTPALKEHVSVESKPKWHDGETKQCYVGVGLVENDVSGGDSGG